MFIIYNKLHLNTKKKREIKTENIYYVLRTDKWNIPTYRPRLKDKPGL